MKIAAFVQARMGSTRLPGKVLKDIEGHPILWHVANQLRHAKQLTQIVIVTSTNPQDDQLETFCRSEGLDCYRGSEEDVLDRYYRSAEHFKPDLIVRITSDCPLIDPGVVDSVIQKHLETKPDYTSNTLERSFPRGMDTEVFTRPALEKAHREAKESREREHVTPYLYHHPDRFRLTSVVATPNQKRPDIRVCVDTPKDLALVLSLFKENSGLAPDLNTILRILSEKPELLTLNASVKQKTV